MVRSGWNSHVCHCKVCVDIFFCVFLHIWVFFEAFSIENVEPPVCLGGTFLAWKGPSNLKIFAEPRRERAAPRFAKIFKLENAHNPLPTTKMQFGIPLDKIQKSKKNRFGLPRLQRAATLPPPSHPLQAILK